MFGKCRSNRENIITIVVFTCEEKKLLFFQQELSAEELLEGCLTSIFKGFNLVFCLFFSLCSNQKEKDILIKYYIDAWAECFILTFWQKQHPLNQPPR